MLDADGNKVWSQDYVDGVPTNFVAEATGKRAVVVATMAECINEPFRAHLATRGLTPLLGLAEGLTALGAAAMPTPTGVTRHAPVAAANHTVLLDEATAKAQ